MAGKRKSEMPNIARYPFQERCDYLMLVAAVAASDGYVNPDELTLLRSWMDSFELSDKGRQEVMEVIQNQPLSLESIQKRLAKSELVFSVILDMMGMAMADGVLMDKEIALLRDVSQQLKITKRDFDILIEFVHSAHQASTLRNPEPLYEHNIDSAFTLMRKRKVRLFPHTLLCATSPEYDQHLKKRWIRFRKN